MTSAIVLVSGLTALGLAIAGFFAVPEAGNPTLISPGGPIDAHNTPTVVRNPLLAGNIVVSNRVDRPSFSGVISSSFDSGGSWAAIGLPLPAGLDRPFAPDLAFAPDGTLWVLYANLTGAGNVPENLWLARSVDGGLNLSDPVRVTGESAFQGRLAIDPVTNRIYVTYLQADELGLLAFEGDAPRIFMRWSDDGGVSFSEPISVSDVGRTTVGAAVPMVSPEGKMVVVYTDYNDDVRDFSNEAGPPWDRPSELVASQFDGVTFRPGATVDDRLLPTRRFLPFLPEFPGVAFSEEGMLHVTWADGREGDLDVFYSTSADDGVTWSSVMRVNDNLVGDGTSQYLPAIDVAPSGRVDILFYDRRDDPDDVWMGVTLASSTDPGEGFENHPLSSLPFDSRIGSSASTDLEPDFGARLGIQSEDREVYATWTDTRLGNAASGRQDIVGRLVARGGPAPIWWYLGSAVALLAGLVYLVFALRREHR